MNYEDPFQMERELCCGAPDSNQILTGHHPGILDTSGRANGRSKSSGAAARSTSPRSPNTQIRYAYHSVYLPAGW